MVAAVGVRATQATVLALGAYPAEGVRATHASVLALEDSNGNVVRVSQAPVLALVLGRTNDPTVRAWTFTLDGHDFYVLRLGTTETLVYDTHSEQWSVYGSEDSDLWRAFTGSNWDGGAAFAGSYGSNVLVGDDGTGVLYFLDPELEMDDDALVGNSNPRQFLRRVTGQIAVKGYDKKRCFQVQLLGSIGAVNNSSLTSVSLSYSDDRGANYSDAGTIDVSQEEYEARLNWRSLGSFKAPGRLFRVSDYGALTRIDNLNMTSEEEE